MQNNRYSDNRYTVDRDIFVSKKVSEDKCSMSFNFVQVGGIRN